MNYKDEDINVQLRRTQKVLFLTMSDEDRQAFLTMFKRLITLNKDASQRTDSQGYLEGKCDAYNNMYKMFDLHGDDVVEFTNLIK